MFVAAFIGSPAMNLYEGTLEQGASAVRIGSQTVALTDQVRTARPALAGYGGRSLVVGIRPEHLPAVDGQDGPELHGDVDLVEALGSEQLVHFTLDARRVLAEGAHEDDAEQLLKHGEGVARVDPRSAVKPGETARFSVDVDRMQFFDAASGEAITG
jgi:multiple sugar transport system ATP-binding protein